ncbi:MAG: class I tRNA ligase family protein [Chloroflexi bacterium]|nr:class I tRNA ligase family protein [Chloroflexota bacterium]
MNRVWNLVLDGPHTSAPEGGGAADADIGRLLHKTMRRVTDDMEKFRYNTMLSALMEFVNALLPSRPRVSRQMWREASERLVVMLAPSAPHMSEELWHRLGHEGSVHLESWPSFDPELAVDSQVTLVLQVNGKVRDRIDVPADLSEAQARQLAMESPKVQQHLDSSPIRTVVYVPGRLVNIVTG